MFDESLKPYYRCRDELTVEAGCLVRGHRTVIPDVLRKPLLKELHAVHIGVTRMKAVARSFFWWPRLDRDIENLVGNCAQCQELSRAPVTEVPHHWIYPSEAFERVHIDYAEFASAHYLLLVDAYSKWIDVFPKGRDCTTSKTIECLLSFISTYGIPKFIVSDNGPQFTSHAFKQFCNENGVQSRDPGSHFGLVATLCTRDLRHGTMQNVIIFAACCVACAFGTKKKATIDQLRVRAFIWCVV